MSGRSHSRYSWVGWLTWYGDQWVIKDLSAYSCFWVPGMTIWSWSPKTQRSLFQQWPTWNGCCWSKPRTNEHLLRICWRFELATFLCGSCIKENCCSSAPMCWSGQQSSQFLLYFVKCWFLGSEALIWNATKTGMVAKVGIFCPRCVVIEWVELLTFSRMVPVCRQMQHNQRRRWDLLRQAASNLWKATNLQMIDCPCNFSVESTVSKIPSLSLLRWQCMSRLLHVLHRMVYTLKLWNIICELQIEDLPNHFSPAIAAYQASGFYILVVPFRGSFLAKHVDYYQNKAKTTIIIEVCRLVPTHWIVVQLCQLHW